MSTERVTVTLPSELVRSIDRTENDRDRFIIEAVERELARSRHEGLLCSLRSPHPEVIDHAMNDLSDWVTDLSPGDADLVDLEAGTPVRWVVGRGWIEDQ